MDLILIGLLIVTLGFGVRLNSRLKALKSGQDDFAKAVADLDKAAIKAHSSLKFLREDADQSQDLLHNRIVAARELNAKLSALIAKAERLDGQMDQRLSEIKSLSELRVEAEKQALNLEKDKLDRLRQTIRSTPLKVETLSHTDIDDDEEVDDDRSSRIDTPLRQKWREMRSRQTSSSQSPIKSASSSSSDRGARNPDADLINVVGGLNALMEALQAKPALDPVREPDRRPDRGQVRGHEPPAYNETKASPRFKRANEDDLFEI